MKTHTPAVPASTTWTCDRCATSETIHAGGDVKTIPTVKPHLWNVIDLDFREGQAGQGHLCPGCSSEAVKPATVMAAAQILLSPDAPWDVPVSKEKTPSYGSVEDVLARCPATFNPVVVGGKVRIYRLILVILNGSVEDAIQETLDEVRSLLAAADLESQDLVHEGQNVVGTVTRTVPF